MTIGIDASRANRRVKTGVEWYAYHLIEALKRIPIAEYRPQVYFILYSDVPLTGELAKLPEGWSSKVLKWPPKRLWTQARLSWEMLRRPPNVLFVPSHVFPIIHPQKTVMTVHDVAAGRFPESYGRFQRWYTLWSAGAALKRLWKVIVPSEFTRKELASLCAGASAHGNIAVIPHGYDTRYRNIEDETEIQGVLEKYGVRRPFILSVGRLEEKKNTQRLVQAFARLQMRNNDMRLILVGGRGHGYEKVKDAISQNPYGITELGHVESNDLVYIMNAAEVFVFPSLCEGFGMPMLEAFACGTPVVASCGNSLEEVGGDAALYVDAENIDDLADAIFLMISDSALRNTMIEKGFARAELFSWERCAAQTLDTLLDKEK